MATRSEDHTWSRAWPSPLPLALPVISQAFGFSQRIFEKSRAKNLGVVLGHMGYGDLGDKSHCKPGTTVGDIPSRASCLA